MSCEHAEVVTGTTLADVPAGGRQAGWLNWIALGGAGLACLIAMLVAGPVLSPEEARHAGIVHDMWAARQYMVPRVNGLPVLDGAPLYYWLAVGFVSVLGLHEWTVRLPSTFAALITVWVMVRVWDTRRYGWPVLALAALGMVQPALVIAGRLAAPDMVNVCLLTIAVGCMARAAANIEGGVDAGRWVVGAWAASALLALGAGPLAPVIPFVMLSAWLALRGRLGLLRAFWSSHGFLVASAIVVPWWSVVSAMYPGIFTAMLHRQAVSILRDRVVDWADPSIELGLILIFAALLPSVACISRWRGSLASLLQNPDTGLMSVWLVVGLLLYPALSMTPAGAAAAIAVPLFYFVMVSLGADDAGDWKRLRLCLLYLGLAVAAVFTALILCTARGSDVLTLAKALGPRYLPSIDKVIMLDRYDYEFSFYMRSPKLVYVVSDWASANDSDAPAWKKELAEAGRFAPETARRMLLGHAGFHERICERRAVNLWVIASEAAARRHMVLADLDPIEGTGRLRAWFLPAEATLQHCRLHKPDA